MISNILEINDILIKHNVENFQVYTMEGCVITYIRIKDKVLIIAPYNLSITECHFNWPMSISDRLRPTDSEIQEPLSYPSHLYIILKTPNKFPSKK